MKTAAALSLLLATAYAVPSIPVDDVFDLWRESYSKSYGSAQEHIDRLAVFNQNKIIVEKHNQGNHSWTMGLNEFADLTSEVPRSTLSAAHKLDSSTALPFSEWIFHPDSLSRTITLSRSSLAYVAHSDCRQ